MCAIEAEELNSFIFKESCKNNHDSLRLAKLILLASTNTLLNNLCFKYNDNLVQEKCTQQKKASNSIIKCFGNSEIMNG